MNLKLSSTDSEDVLLNQLIHDLQVPTPLQMNKIPFFDHDETPPAFQKTREVNKLTPDNYSQKNYHDNYQKSHKVFNAFPHYGEPHYGRGLPYSLASDSMIVEHHQPSPRNYSPRNYSPRHCERSLEDSHSSHYCQTSSQCPDETASSSLQKKASSPRLSTFEKYKLKLELANNFVHYYANAINTYFTTFAETMSRICFQSLDITIMAQNTHSCVPYFASLFSPLNLTCLPWTKSVFDFHQLVFLVNRLQQISPNFILSILSTDCIESEEEKGVTIYMATFKCSGTIVVNDPRYLGNGNSHSQNRLSMNELMTAPEICFQNSTGPYPTHQWKEFEVIGSFAMHRYKNDKIHKMEFMYEYS